jgi:hypothetical protein
MTRGTPANDLQGKQILATCPHLDATASHVAGFADMLITRTGLTLSHSSGAVEGAVNRIKLIKRQMYGRAKLDLRHARIHHAP